MIDQKERVRISVTEPSEAGEGSSILRRGPLRQLIERVSQDSAQRRRLLQFVFRRLLIKIVMLDAVVTISWNYLS